MSLRRAHSPGMTLVELMIAVAVLAMITSMVWASFSETTRTKTVIEERQARGHEVRLAMSRMAREIAEAFLTKNYSNEGQLVTTPKSIFASEDRPPFDRIDFAAFAHHRLYRDANESDQSEISYFVTTDRQDRSMDNLVRRESSRIDEDPRHGGTVLVMVEDVAEFDLTFFDVQSQEWVDFWDTASLDGQPDRLPAFVKILLVVNQGEGRTRRFVEKVSIPIENPIPEPRVKTLRVGTGLGRATGEQQQHPAEGGNPSGRDPRIPRIPGFGGLGGQP
jgi:general secretion pathway protein J